jgi:hypothetical protein
VLIFADGFDLIPLLLGEKAVAAGQYKSDNAKPYTQILWEGTKYVGCADATSSQSGTACTSSVCYYGLVRLLCILNRLLSHF